MTSPEIRNGQLQPPDSLRDVLRIVAAYENGQINDLSPDGIAVMRFLQNASYSGQVIAASAELTEV